MINVFRVETKAGEGMFYTGLDRVYSKNHRCRDSYHAATDMPGPLCLDEKGTSLHNYFENLDFSHNSNYSDYIFAFYSLNDVKKFMRSKKGRKHLQLAGCFLNEYEIPETTILKGNHQLAFLRDRAKFIRRYDLETFEIVEEEQVYA